MSVDIEMGEREAASVEAGAVEAGEVGIDLRADGPRPSEPLRGRLAVVTGGSGRLGRAIALELAAAGARVCIIGRDLTRLRQTTETAGRAAPMLYLQCDLGSVREVEGLGEFIERFDRPIDLLVHAAGVSVTGTVADGVAADFDEQYLVNVRGALLVTQTFMAQLRQGGGEVVFVRRAERAADTTVARVAAAGVAAVAAGLAAEEAENGVRVSSVVLDEGLDAGIVARSVLSVVGALHTTGAVGGFELTLAAPAAAGVSPQ